MTPHRSAAARLALVLFAGAGLIASGASTYVHYRLLQDRGYTSFCDVSGTVSCTEAYLSRYGSLGGVPVALLGFLFFVLAFVLAVLAMRSRTETRDNAVGYLFAVSTVGLAVVLYLGYAAFVVLRLVCVLCVGTYLAVAGLFVISGIVMDYPMTTVPRRFGRDLRRLTSSPAAIAVALVFVFGAASSIAFFPKEPGEPQAPTIANAKKQEQAGAQSEFERWYFAQPIVDAGVPMEGAKVLVVKFNDFMCPACGQSYREYKGIFAKYQAAYPGAVRQVTKDYPLDPECNFNTPRGQHEAACEAAAAVRMAAARGKAEAMTEWLYSNQSSLTPQSVKQAAGSVGGVTDFDAQYPKVLQAIKADVAAGGAINVRSTPTFIINGRMLAGMLPAQFFDQAIALELKRAGVSK